MKKNKSSHRRTEEGAAAAKINLPADWKPSADVIVYDAEFEAGQAIERLQRRGSGGLV